MKLFKIIINANNYCNYSCDYCSAGIPYKHNSHINLDCNKLNIVVNNINKYLPNDYEILYNVHGGEPTLHPEFNDIIKILQKTKNRKHLRILSNGSVDFSKTFHDVENIDVGFSIHYQQMLNNNFKDKYDLLFANIDYLMKTNNTFFLNILINHDTPKDVIDMIINDSKAKYKNIFCDLINITPNDYYKIDNYDYSILDNVYNRNDTTKAVYPYRIIGADVDLNFYYLCAILPRLPKEVSNNFSKNLMSRKCWNIICKYLDTPVYCNYKECVCSECLDVVLT